MQSSINHLRLRTHRNKDGYRRLKQLQRDRKENLKIFSYFVLFTPLNHTQLIK